MDIEKLKNIELHLLEYLRLLKIDILKTQEESEKYKYLEFKILLVKESIAYLERFGEYI